MPSVAYNTWTNTRLPELDRIEVAHARVGGVGRGRRFTTHQINQAYAVLLSSQFQGFCRDLHSESVDIIVSAVNPHALQIPLRSEFLLNRKLDKGNPCSGNIGSDFNRLGLLFWDEVNNADARNARRHNLIEALNDWRNAIAHQDFSSQALRGQTQLRLADVRRWRVACEGLAIHFDAIVRDHIGSIIGRLPWN